MMIIHFQTSKKPDNNNDDDTNITTMIGLVLCMRVSRERNPFVLFCFPFGVY